MKGTKGTITLDINMKNGERWILYYLSPEDRDRAFHSKKVGRPLVICSEDGVINIDGKEIKSIDV